MSDYKPRAKRLTKERLLQYVQRTHDENGNFVPASLRRRNAYRLAALDGYNSEALATFDDDPIKIREETVAPYHMFTEPRRAALDTLSGTKGKYLHIDSAKARSMIVSCLEEFMFDMPNPFSIRPRYPLPRPDDLYDAVRQAVKKWQDDNDETLVVIEDPRRIALRLTKNVYPENTVEINMIEGDINASLTGTETLRAFR